MLPGQALARAAAPFLYMKQEPCQESPEPPKTWKKTHEPHKPGPKPHEIKGIQVKSTLQSKSS
jgi:hypothetical protein